MNSTFNIEKKGYNRAEVERTVNLLETENATLKHDIEVLKNTLSECNDRLYKLEERKMLIEETLVSAEMMARQRIQEATASAEKINNSYIEENEALKAEIAQRREELEETVKRMEYVLKSQLSLLENNKNGIVTK